MVNDKTLFPTNVVYTTHDWHDTIDAVRSIERSGGIVGVDIKTFRRATPSSVGRSGKIAIFPDLPTDDGVARRNVLMSTPTIPPDLSIDLTASIVSCQSCVVYTTFVGNSVLSFTTSKLNYMSIPFDAFIECQPSTLESCGKTFIAHMKYSSVNA